MIFPRRTLYSQISTAFWLLIAILGATQYYVLSRLWHFGEQEFLQRLNWDIAANIALELQPLLNDKDAVQEYLARLYDIHPAIDVYLIDSKGDPVFTTGHLVSISKWTKKDSKSRLGPIEDFLKVTPNRSLPLLGIDPHRPNGNKVIFSAARIMLGTQAGYVYVVLEGSRYDSALEGVEAYYALSKGFTGFLILLLFTGIVGAVIFIRITKRFNRVSSKVSEIASGNLEARVENLTGDDEIGALGSQINQMADTIQGNIKAIKEKDNLRRELVANVSHELRRPIAMMQASWATLLSDSISLSDSERNEIIEKALRSCEALGKLVAELFSLSKLNASEVKPNIEPFSIEDLCRDLIIKFQSISREKNLSLEIAVEDNLPFVIGDPFMIEQAISNLLENALRYTPASGNVRLELVRSQAKTTVSVSDSGVGIPEEEIPLVFDRFFRASKTAGSTEGTGLGLAITKRIVEVHNSQLHVQSTLGKGTTFAFSLDVDPEN